MSVVVSYEPITVDTDNVHSKTIVDKPISIVVDAVVVAIRGVLKHVRCKIRVSEFDPRINDGYNRVGAAGRQAPRFRRPNVGARGTPSLARVMQAPELGEPRVVRGCERADEIVRLRVEHVGTRAECLERLAHGHARRQLYALKPLGDPELPDDSRTYSRMGEAAGEGRRRFTEPDQNLVRHISMWRRICAGFETRLRGCGVRRCCRRCGKGGRGADAGREKCERHGAQRRSRAAMHPASLFFKIYFVFSIFHDCGSACQELST